MERFISLHVKHDDFSVFFLDGEISCWLSLVADALDHAWECFGEEDAKDVTGLSADRQASYWDKACERLESNERESARWAEKLGVTHC